VSNFHSWRVRSVRTILAAVTASALMVSGAVFAVSASAANGATQIVIKTQPATTANSGVALTQQPIVWIADASGAAVSLNSTVTATITSQSSSAQLANASVVAVNGVATFSNLILNTLVGTYTLTFTDTTDSVTSVASTSITVSAGAAAKLAVTTQPSLGEVTGNALVTQPVVTVEDVNGNPVTSISSGTVAASTTSLGCTVTGGSTSGIIISGVATFSGLTMTATSGTNCVLTFTYLSLPTVDSTSVLMSNAATHLVITTQPSSSGLSGAALSPQPVVKIYDSNSTPTQVKSDTSTVTATITSGTGTVTNATAVAVAGVATFSGLALNAPAALNYTLTFTDGSLTPATSSAITITAGAATKLSVVTQPSTTTASGAVLAQVPQVRVLDSGGNLVSSSATITATFTSGGVSITNPTATAVSGTATFTGMALNALVGSYTITFSSPSLTAAVSTSVYVSAGAATKLAIATQPPTSVASGVAMTTPPVVKVVDSGGNVVTSNYSTVTATVTSGIYSLSNPTAAAVAGTATFSGLALNAPVGSYTLTFTAVGLTPIISNLVSVTSGAPTHLVITTQPSPTQASGVPLAVVPVVKVEDVAGNVVTADASLVSAKITSGGVSVTNGAQTAVNGIATFTGLALNAKVGTYTLTFTDGTLSPAVSTSVTIYVGPATHLAVSTEPSAVAQSGVAFATQPVVAVLDSGGNVVTAVNSGYATAGIASGSGGVISAGAVATFVSGVASFSGLAIAGTNGVSYGLVYSGAGFSVVDTSRVTLGTAQSPLIITTLRATYGRNLRLATRGGSGTGPVTYAVVNGTAKACRLNGAVLFYSSTGTCIVTATKAASGNYLAVSSSPTTVTVVKLRIPRVVNVYFYGNSAGLTNQARHSLILLARQLTSASKVRILGFAPHNIRLARARGQNVRAFLNARVHSHFQLVNQTNTRLQLVRVTTLSQ